MMLNVFAFLDRLLRAVLLLGTFYFVLLSLSNIAWLRLSSHRPGQRKGRMVSVLVPARNEEKNIAQLPGLAPGPDLRQLRDRGPRRPVHRRDVGDPLQATQSGSPSGSAPSAGEPLDGTGWLRQAARHAAALARMRAASTCCSRTPTRSTAGRASRGP